jgi:hypothetical protein
MLDSKIQTWVENNQQFLKEYTLKQYPYLSFKKGSYGPVDLKTEKIYSEKSIVVKDSVQQYGKDYDNYLLPLYLPEYKFIFVYAPRAKYLIIDSYQNHDPEFQILLHIIYPDPIIEVRDVLRIGKKQIFSPQTYEKLIHDPNGESISTITQSIFSSKDFSEMYQHFIDKAIQDIVDA